MAKRKIGPDEITAAFELYLLHNGERHDLIEKEMHRRGFTSFRKSVLTSRGTGENRREGWIESHGWRSSLELKIATANTAAATSAESLLFEVEEIRKKLFIQIQAAGVVKAGRDLVYQHDKYTNRSIEILSQLNDARDNFGNFVAFLDRLCAAAPSISPALARELVAAKEGLMDWAEGEFTAKEELTADERG